MLEQKFIIEVDEYQAAYIKWMLDARFNKFKGESTSFKDLYDQLVKINHEVEELYKKEIMENAKNKKHGKHR